MLFVFVVCVTKSEHVFVSLTALDTAQNTLQSALDFSKSFATSAFDIGKSYLESAKGICAIRFLFIFNFEASVVSRYIFLVTLFF